MHVISKPTSLPLQAQEPLQYCNILDSAAASEIVIRTIVCLCVWIEVTGESSMLTEMLTQMVRLL
jgi:hypothetical protein